MKACVKNLKIIKVGGSVITRKDKDYVPDAASIRKLAAALSKIPGKYLLVHGTGSFGKPPAVKYGYARDGVVRSGRVPCAGIKLGVLRLHFLFMKELVKLGVKAVSFGADETLEVRGGSVKRVFARRIKKWLKMGFVPVIRADMVPDQKSGLRVCSSDLLAAALAGALGAGELVFLTDVDGIRDAWGGLIEKAGKNEIAEISRNIKKEPLDVSGGMGGKISALKPYLKKKFSVRILNGRKKKHLSALLKGDSGCGTLII